MAKSKSEEKIETDTEKPSQEQAEQPDNKDEKDLLAEQDGKRAEEAETGDDKKRKDPPTKSEEDQPAKKATKTDSTEKSDTTIADKINTLLSSKAESLYKHDDKRLSEKDATKSYFSIGDDLNSWEHFLCALVVSRPLSHVLGQRAVQVLLNSPYSMSTPQKVLDAGESKVYEALEEAHTQHRQKTASQILQAAEYLVSEKIDDGKGSMKGLEKQDVKGIKDTLGKVNGVGSVACDVFLRRLQGCAGWWGSIGPYVDGKAGEALKKAGLPDDAEGLLSALRDEWGSIDELTGEKPKDDGELARAFATVVERALGIGLEGNEDQV